MVFYFGTLSTHVQSLGNVDLTQFQVSRPCLQPSVNCHLVLLPRCCYHPDRYFFITSADSATYVLAMLSDDGNLKQRMTLKSSGAYSLRYCHRLTSFRGLSSLAKYADYRSLSIFTHHGTDHGFLVIELLHEKDKMGLSITRHDTLKKINLQIL